MRALLLSLLIIVVPGCPGEDACGPGGAAGDGLVVSGTGVDLRYHDLVASANNDCPDPAAPVGVISLTISGAQLGGGDAITFCVPRPDLFGSDLPLLGSVPTGHGSNVEIVDVNAAAGGCTFARNIQTPPSGVARAEGICEDGTDPAGFALVITGQVSVDRTCGADPTETLRLDLTGTVEVVTP